MGLLDFGVPGVRKRGVAVPLDMPRRGAIPTATSGKATHTTALGLSLPTIRRYCDFVRVVNKRIIAKAAIVLVTASPPRSFNVLVAISGPSFPEDPLTLWGR